MSHWCTHAHTQPFACDILIHPGLIPPGPELISRVKNYNRLVAGAAGGHEHEARTGIPCVGPGQTRVDHTASKTIYRKTEAGGVAANDLGMMRNRMYYSS